MNTEIVDIKSLPVETSLAFLLDINTEAKPVQSSISDAEWSYILSCFAKKQYLVFINRLVSGLWFVGIDTTKPQAIVAESVRKSANEVVNQINKHKFDTLGVSATTELEKWVTAFAEGAILGNYQFLKHFSANADKFNSLSKIGISASEAECAELKAVTTAVNFTRDLVNEPVNHLNAELLAEKAVAACESRGVRVEVFDFTQIESLKMGGLLAVNKGSIDPPTFTIMEWKPANAVNKQPIVLVGKGVTYDTGGLSLKPTPGSMDSMKSDMAGAAAVIGTLRAIAEVSLPIYVVGLVPATDNRPGGNAYTPGDVITMHNGKTVEVLNTDAEGRMILADALSYSKVYNPSLVIDLATLTGAAVRAIGKEAAVIMGTASDDVFAELISSGENVYERVVHFPFWDEYAEYIKSDIADMKNIGGADAGAITAGKFLENFVESPWIHVDIAAPSWLGAPSSYRPKGGTGYGVRLLFNFLKNRTIQQ